MKKVFIICLSVIMLLTCTSCAQKGSLFEYGEITTIPMSESTKVMQDALRESGENLSLTEEYYPSLIAALEARETPKFPIVETANKQEKKEYADGAVYTLTPDKVEAVIFYLHGGAYAYEAVSSHVEFCDMLATRLNAVAYIPDYPLTPENTYEAAYALLDEVYEDILALDLPIYIMGDSAGGGLSLAYTEYLAADGRQLPDKLVLLSPWVDITCSNPDIPEYEKVDLTLAAYAAIELGKLWAGDLDVNDPLVSPLNGQLEGLPDTLIFCGSDEIMLPDNELLFNRMKEAGCNVALIEGEGFWHVYPIYGVAEQATCIDMIAQHVNN